MDTAERVIRKLRIALAAGNLRQGIELQRLRNYRDNVNRLIRRAQDDLTVNHPVFWVLDDLDDSYYDTLPDQHFQEL